jgi:hypothetical protein
MFNTTNANVMYSGGNRVDHYNNYETDDDFPQPLYSNGGQYHNIFTLLCIAILNSLYSTPVNLLSWYRIAKYSHEASV